MYVGYNTNGFAHHRLVDALDILAELGYQGVALALDQHHLNPFEPDLPKRVEQVRRQLERLNLRCVIETGARFLLDPRRKHQPTLLSPTPEERQRRLDFLYQAVLIAQELGADGVSFWSGAPIDEAEAPVLWDRLIDGCQQLAEAAAAGKVRLAFEPEPGMFVDTLDRFKTLHTTIGSPWFGLTLDVGHVQCQDEGFIAERVREWKDILWNIHIEDMRKGVHDHLMFGEGEIDFPPIFQALKTINYQGGAFVELSRHSHDAVTTARKALAFLQAARDNKTTAG